MNATKTNKWTFQGDGYEFKAETLGWRDDLRVLNIYDENLAPIAYVNGWDEASKQNARIIAAAPELLAALEALLSDVEFAQPQIETGLIGNRQIRKAREVIDNIISEPQPQADPETPASDLILDAVALDVTPEPEPAPAPEPVAPEFPESAAARAWLETLDLDGIPEDKSERTQVYKYDLVLFHAKSARGEYFLSTRSPQQRTASSWSHDIIAVGDTRDDLKAGLERFLEGREKKETARWERIAANKAAREAFTNPYKVGDILHSSWGYDQTNVEFFQVVDVRPTSIKISQIAGESVGATGPDSDQVIPCPGEFLDRRQNIWTTIQIDARYKGHSIPSPIHGNLSLYDGAPCYRSWGH